MRSVKKEFPQFAKPYSGMTDPENMEFVCNDINKDSVWKFDSDKEKYVRFSKGKDILSYLSLRFLSDPFLLWERRKKLYPQADPNDLRPQDATFALFAHKEKYNAKRNA